MAERIPDEPPALAAAAVAAHLANTGVTAGLGTWTRHTLADQALRSVYRIGYRLVRAVDLADRDRERDELLAELAEVRAERDRLAARARAGVGAALVQRLDEPLPWPLDTDPPNPPAAPPPAAPTYEVVEKGGRVDPQPTRTCTRRRRRGARRG